MRILILSLLFSLTSYSAGFGNKSNGYRMGELTKFSVKGLINKSGEGKLNMGNEGGPRYKKYKCGESQCTKYINPWRFSSDMNMVPSIKKFQGEYVVMEYSESHIKNALASNTPYSIKAVYPVTPEMAIEPSYNITAKSNTKSEGFRTGRIVKASKKGLLTKTWEIILQEGNSGATYKHMSISDQGLFDYAVKCLKKAKRVNVYYTENAFYQMNMNDTNYIVHKITQKKGLN